MNHVIEPGVLEPPGFEHILYLHGIGQLIVGQHIAVPVINIAAGTGDVPGLLYLQDEFLQILLSMDNLQLKAAVNQHAGKQAEYNREDCQPAGDDADYFFLELIKQISALSFSHDSPAFHSPSEQPDIKTGSLQWYTVPPAG